jgi:hypothetical protein
MPEVAEWYLLGRAGVQLVQDGERAGKSMATIGINSVDQLVAELAERGVGVTATPPGSGAFRLVRLPDPNGNIVTFAEDTR